MSAHRAKRWRERVGGPAGPGPMLGLLLATWIVSIITLLAACGPGLGGTGTGASPEPLGAFGAEPVSVCQSEFADLLDCTGGVTTAPQATPRWFADSEPASRVLLELSGQDAFLTLRCAGAEFAGTWGQVPGQTPRYFGRLVEPLGEMRALLLVARTASGLSLQVADEFGSVIYSGLALRPVAAATSGQACP